MDAIIIFIIFGSIFGSIVAGRALKYRHAERMKELEAGGRRPEADKEVKALTAAKAELEELAGCYPDPETCRRWKTALKEIRKELQAEEATRAARGEPDCDPSEDA